MVANRKILVQSAIGLVVVLAYLAACGTETRKFDNPHDPNGEGGSSTSATDSSGGDNGGTTSTTTTTTSGVSSDGNTPASTALAYSNYMELAGITSIKSVIRSGSLFYLTVANGNTSYLAMLDDSGQLTLKDISDVGTGSIPMTNSSSSAYYLATGIDDADSLYVLGNNYDRPVIQIDRASLTATGKISLACSDYGNSTVSYPYNLYKANSRWNYYQGNSGSSYNMVCGMADGTKLDQQTVKQPANTDFTATTGQLYADGANYWIYYRGNASTKGWLNKFSTSFEIEERYSTNGYLYDGSSAMFVSDQTSYWFFGCKDNRCYRADVTMVEQ